MDNGFWTFTGVGENPHKAIADAEWQVRDWLKSHQWRGTNNEVLYGFHHGHLTEDSEHGFLYVISAFVPSEESDDKPLTEIRKDAELGALVRKIPYGCYLDHSGIKPLEWSCVLPGRTGRSETPEGALKAALEVSNG